MRLARVIGNLTLSRKLETLRRGTWLIVEAFDWHALQGRDRGARRQKPMPESLIVYDELGAGRGDIIAVSEGREAAMPFYPEKFPIDAYNAAIIDRIETQEAG